MLDLLILLVVGFFALMFALWFALAVLGALADGFRRLTQGPPRPIPPTTTFGEYSAREWHDWDDDV